MVSDLYGACRQINREGVRMGSSDPHIRIFRCQTCGLLLTNRMIARGLCAGHHVRYAMRGTFFEWIYINIRLWIEGLSDRRKKAAE